MFLSFPSLPDMRTYLLAVSVVLSIALGYLLHAQMAHSDSLFAMIMANGLAERATDAIEDTATQLLAGKIPDPPRQTGYYVSKDDGGPRLDRHDVAVDPGSDSRRFTAGPLAPRVCAQALQTLSPALPPSVRIAADAQASGAPTWRSVSEWRQAGAAVACYGGAVAYIHVLIDRASSSSP